LNLMKVWKVIKDKIPLTRIIVVLNIEVYNNLSLYISHWLYDNYDEWIMQESDWLRCYHKDACRDRQFT
jgi:hypothetical protein